MRTVGYTEGNHVHMYFLGNVHSQKKKPYRNMWEKESQHDVLSFFFFFKEATVQFTAENNSFSSVTV